MRLAAGGRASLIARALARLELRFPTLFALFLGATILDLLVPDVLPFLDELGLALLTLLLGLWKDRRRPPANPATPSPVSETGKPATRR